MALAEPESHLVTLEELEQLPDEGGRCDLLWGELIRMSPASRRHGRLAMSVGARLFAYTREKGLGEVYTAETGFLLARHPDVVLAPDVAFVRQERLVDVAEDRFLPFAPDLAVEVISPSDRARDVSRKIQAYLDAGVRLLWVVEPESQTISVYRPDRTARLLRPGEELSGEDVLPELRLAVAELFS